MNTKPYIEAGWHTVPLTGELKRLPDGSKTIPQFEKGWRQKYTAQRNKKVTKLGGVITGRVSNILAVDCDNEDTYNLFRSLDPSAPCLVSVGKGKSAGTLLYSYDPDITTFSVADGSIALDVYSDNGFIYLPTEANTTKEPWLEVPQLTPAPASVKLLIQQLQKKNSAPAQEGHYVSSQTAPCLAPLLQQFVGKRGEFIPSLFKVLTPRSFRKEEQYQKYGYLHPDNVPAGAGSEYLSKVSAILGADESVSEELYVDVMTCVNALFSDSMDQDRIDKTILTPMLEGGAAINGVPIWAYNEHWSDERMTVTTKHGLIVDLCFDDRRGLYYYLDMTNEQVKSWQRDTDFVAYLDVTVKSELPKKAALKKKLPIAHITSNPAVPFGFCKSDIPQVLGFNSFQPGPELAILHKPEDYSRFYKRPEVLLKYLETLVPNEAARVYLLRFIKTKLTTFSYSPVVLYFLGVPGSGKDTFVQVLEQIMGHMSRPTTSEFMEVYNTWMLDTYFVQLDEYGDQLSKLHEKELVKGRLKAFTGKPTVQIRGMRQEGYNVKHAVTFIMTANKNPLLMDDQDRRIHLMETPNVLEIQPWFNANSHDQIFSEVKDFCYYLATEVKVLPKNEYVTPPLSDDKQKLIANSMFAANRLAYAISHDMVDYLVDIGNDTSCRGFVDDIRAGKLSSRNLEIVYDELTDFKGDSKSLRKVLRKQSGITMVPTTKDGEPAYYIELNPFGSTEDE